MYDYVLFHHPIQCIFHGKEKEGLTVEGNWNLEPKEETGSNFLRQVLVSWLGGPIMTTLRVRLYVHMGIKDI